MARKPRVEFEGAVYHVMCRGNRQEPIFEENRDYEVFLDTLGEVCKRTGWHVDAFALMGNHYHFLLETPEPNLVDGMRWFQGTYTQRFNARHQVWGHLFQGRYKALLVDDGEYFAAVADYIHLNPARDFANSPLAKMLSRVETWSLSDYTWSSYVGYLRPACRPEWLRTARVLSMLGMMDTSAGRSAYRRRMQKKVLEVLHDKNPVDINEQWKKIRRGWAFGSEEFLERMQRAVDGAMKGKRRDSFQGDAAKKHDESEAERLFSSGLTSCGLSSSDLEVLKKGDDRKKAIAWFIRRNTSVKNEWISGRLRMGNVSNLSRYIKIVEDAEDGELSRLKRKITAK